MQSDDQLENTNEELAVNDSVPEAMAAEASSDKAKVAPKRRQGETAARKGTARKRGEGENFGLRALCYKQKAPSQGKKPPNWRGNNYIWPTGVVL